MPRLPSTIRPRAALAAAIGLALLARPASGQALLGKVVLKSPAPFQVVQRGADGSGEVPLVLPDGLNVPGDFKNVKVLGAGVWRRGPGPGSGQPVSIDVPGARYRDGRLERIPVGGPYHVWVRVRTPRAGELALESGPFFVGDLWVLAGQSNMQGVGNLVDVTPPHPKVMALGMDGRWVQAVEPLHWLLDSPDPIHSGDPATRAQRSAEEHASRTKGAGLGLPFGAAMADATGVPVGLVACAHGGTSMAQWSPSKRGEGGMSLYGSMLRQVRLAGGKVKGVLWYQGESDTPDQALADGYAGAFAAFIAAVRADLGRPDLPFYYVQIGRVIGSVGPRPWNTVQEAQRRLAEVIPHTAVVSVIDLELDDAVHVGTQGLKRVGRRLARVAVRDLFGQAGGASTPMLGDISKGAGDTLIVKFKGVSLSASDGLKPERHVGGFSIRAADGTPLPLIYEAMVGPSRDAVVLKLNGQAPPGAFLWYGWGLDPYCNLTDALAMAVPVFGPIPLDGVR